MKTMTCIIAEDEKPAQRLLESYIKRMPGLELLATCSNAPEALQFLRQNPVDLIFLDLNMPGMSGLEFLESLDSKPAVIITTAYRQYALEGFEHGVADYLLKPFSFQRFCKAVNRSAGFARERQVPEHPVRSDVGQEAGFVEIKTDTGETRLPVSEILFVESFGNYLKIHCINHRYVIRETLAGFYRKLPPERFLRVHRSFIVALARVDHFTGNTLKVGEMTIPAGNLYKPLIREALGLAGF